MPTPAPPRTALQCLWARPLLSSAQLAAQHLAAAAIAFVSRMHMCQVRPDVSVCRCNRQHKRPFGLTQLLLLTVCWTDVLNSTNSVTHTQCHKLEDCRTDLAAPDVRLQLLLRLLPAGRLSPQAPAPDCVLRKHRCESPQLAAASVVCRLLLPDGLLLLAPEQVHGRV